jgi:hydrogenase expression/formation protein HypD
MKENKINKVIDFLKNYNGPQIKLMEVCGTHTSVIAKSGIRSLLSPAIKLIAGPGCPVCVTPTSYIDKCVEYALKENHTLVTFGDMMKVPGEDLSLSDAKGQGARVELMYSPFEVLELAAMNKDKTYVFAATGFETTAPLYALLIKEARLKGISNIKLLSALKTIIPALSWICENEKSISGFISPGHVSAIIGSGGYESLHKKYNKPFVIAGFEPEHILLSICELVLMLSGAKKPGVYNLYKNAVKDGGNDKAQMTIDECFEPGSAMWRGIGIIENSGLYLNEKYREYDAGSCGLDKDKALPKGCRCKDVIVGRINPTECQMFGELCNPSNPLGACMVAEEGTCAIYFKY